MLPNGSDLSLMVYRDSKHARKEVPAFKLAAVAAQSSKGKLDFGVTSEGMFYLEMHYSLILEAAS